MSALLIPLTAFAQQTATAPQAPPSALQQKLDSIYQRLLQNPADIVLNRRMIEVALELKDYDAAIGAVERLIFYQPSDPALQLEAARLYFEIGSFAAARGYLTDALALPGVTGDVRVEIDALVAKIDKATRPPIWAGLVQAGFRYQTNANVAPYDLGADNPLTVEEPQEDWNAFALGTLILNNPVNDYLVIEGSMSGYYADQYKVNRLDLGFAEIIFGPRFVANDRFSFKPYAITQGFLLGSDPYQFAYGGGALLTLALTDEFSIEPQFEYKNRTFYDSEDYPDATDQTGDFFSYAFNLFGDLSDKTTWRTRLAFNDNNAATDYQSYDQYLASISVRIEDIFGWENWVVTPFARVFWADYKGVAPTEVTLGEDTVRSDFQWNIGANIEIPIREQVALGLQIQYFENDSNLDRFNYRNLQTLIGPVGRF